MGMLTATLFTLASLSSAVPAQMEPYVPAPRPKIEIFEVSPNTLFCTSITGVQTVLGSKSRFVADGPFQSPSTYCFLTPKGFYASTEEIEPFKNDFVSTNIIRLRVFTLGDQLPVYLGIYYTYSP